MHGNAVQTTTQRLSDPAHDNQRIFRAILLTMSRPGTVTAIGNWPSPPNGLHPAAAAACLTLVDMETPLWMAPDTPKDIQTYLRFHCGCPLATTPEQGAFGLILDGTKLPDLDQFNPGDIEYPDRSSTLIIQVQSLDVRHGIELSGPGINGTTRLHVKGLDTIFWQALQRNNRRFPLGYDVILTTKTEIVSLPRTVQVGI